MQLFSSGLFSFCLLLFYFVSFSYLGTRLFIHQRILIKLFFWIAKVIFHWSKSGIMQDLSYFENVKNASLNNAVFTFSFYFLQRVDTFRIFLLITVIFVLINNLLFFFNFICFTIERNCCKESKDKQRQTNRYKLGKRKRIQMSE